MSVLWKSYVLIKLEIRYKLANSLYVKNISFEITNLSIFVIQFVCD